MCDGWFYVSTWLGHRVPKDLVRHYFGCLCEGVLDERDKWNPDLQDEWSRLFSAMWMDLIALAEGLNRTKRLALPQVKKNSFCLTTFKLGHWVSPAFGLKMKPTFPGSWIWGPLGWTIMPSAPLGLQLADSSCRY